MNYAAFFKRFASNLAQLETLGCEIVEQSGLNVSAPFGRSKLISVRSDSFATVFSPKGNFAESPASELAPTI